MTQTLRPLRLLILEDVPFDLELVVHELRNAGFELEYTHVQTEADYLAVLDPHLDLILSDYNLPAFNGMRALRLLNESGLDIPFILISGTIGEEHAVMAIKEGAADYLLKDRLVRLGPAVSSAIEQKRLRDEKRQTDEALRESNEFNERLLQTVPSPMDIVDEEGRILYMNPAMERLSGRNVIGAHCWELYKDDRQQCADCPLKRDIEVGVTSTFETSGMLGGRAFEVSYTGMNFGGRKALLKVYHDITERKQAREALASERNLLRTLIDHIPDSIYAKDTESRFTLKNRTNALLMGAASPDETLGKTDFDYYPPEVAAKFFEDDQAVIRSDQAIINREEPYKDPSGRNGWVLTTKVPLHDEQGNIVGLVGIGREITEQKLAREQLKQNEVTLKRSQALANVGNWIWDTESNTVSWSDEMYRIFGLDPETFTGDLNAVIAQAIHPDDREALMASNRAVIEEQKPGEMEYRVIWPDGSIRHIWAYPDEPILDQEGRVKTLSGIVQDITVRKRTSEALVSERNLLRTLIDHIPDSIYAKDTESRFTLKNRADAFQMGAASPDETLGKTDFDYYQPEVAAKFFEDDQAVIRSGQAIINREEPYEVPSGRSGWVSTTKVPLHDEQGNVVGLVGVGRDITEQKQAAARLEIQLRRLGALREIDTAISGNLDLQSTLDLVVQQTTKHLDVDAAVVLLLNPHTQMLTYGANLGLRTNSAMTTSIRLHEAFIGRAAREGRTVQIDDPAQVQGYPDFAAFWADEGFVAYYGVPLMAKESVIGVLEVFHHTPFTADNEWRDFIAILAGQAAIAIDNAKLFEETRRLLQQTQTQTQQLEQVMATVSAGILLLDSDYRVLMANATAKEQLILLTGSEVDGNPEDPDVQLTHLGEHPVASLMTPPAPGTQFHEVTISQSEQKYIFEVLAQPVTALDDCDQWVLTLMDVTQERINKESIKQHERLAAVGQLASGIAHDFNNIISTIILLAQLIPRTQELSSMNQERVDNIIGQSHHAVNLIRQLLDFSRSSVIERSSIDLLPALKETIKLLGRTLPGTIHLELDAEPGEYVVEADLSRLQQVFLNLAVNARDAMPEGGDLRIVLERLEAKAENVPVSGMAPGSWLCLNVADNGTGIPPEIVSRIFDPFFTTKEPGSGTGLGLSQVYGIIKQHGGEVAVTSQVGKGTIFTLYLPAANSSVQTESTLRRRLRVRGNGERILVVEDEGFLRQAIQEILENDGYQVFTAENGLQAVDLFEQQDQAMDLVLSDMVMPEMGGMELMRTLRKLQPELKMMLMTGYPLQDEDKEQLEKQVVHWIQKPFFGTKLEDTVQAMLKNGSPS